MKVFFLSYHKMALFTAEGVYSAAWLGDTAIAYGLSNDVVVHDVVAGAVVRRIELVGPVTDIVVHPLGTETSALGRLSVGSWRLPGGEQVQMLDRATLALPQCEHLAYYDDMLVFGVGSRPPPSLSCRAVTNVLTVMYGDEFKAPDGRHIIRLTDAHGGVAEFYGHDSPVRAMHFSPDSLRAAIITADHRMTVLDLTRGALHVMISIKDLVETCGSETAQKLYNRAVRK